MLDLQSKLPDLGVTIFSTMSALAQQLGALNLSQGFPDFPAPPDLIEALGRASTSGFSVCTWRWFTVITRFGR